MATSSRLRGNTYYMTLDIAASPVDYSDDVKEWSLGWEPKDDSDLTFAEAAAGILQDGKFTLRALLSWDATSLCKFLWDNAGQDIDFVVGPWGNSTATATKPHFTFTAASTGKPPLGNQAKSAADVTGAEFELEFTASTDVTVVVA